MTRPRSLAEVALRSQTGNFNSHLREFVDEFDKLDDVEAQLRMVQEEPVCAVGIDKAYLAAVAEFLSRKRSRRPPAWTEAADCFLLKPYFGSPLQSHKAILIASSPAAFRRRSIFVDAHPLSRPHAHNTLAGAP